MNIGNSFKDAIKRVFYDKEFTRYTVVVQPDDEGHTHNVLANAGTFKGNIHHKGLKELQEQYGLQVEAVAYITTDFLDISLNDVIEYSGRKYKVVQVVPYDSHQLIILTSYDN